MRRKQTTYRPNPAPPLVPGLDPELQRQFSDLVQRMQHLESTVRQPPLPPPAPGSSAVEREVRRWQRNQAQQPPPAPPQAKEKGSPTMDDQRFAWVELELQRLQAQIRALTTADDTLGKQLVRKVQQFQVTAVHDDYLSCIYQSADVVGDAEVKVAKPPLLRESVATWNGYTFDYAGGTVTGPPLVKQRLVRLASTSEEVRTETLQPPYVAGDTIFAVQGSSGRIVVKDDDGDDLRLWWLDLNVEGRQWVEPGGGAVFVKVTSILDGPTAPYNPYYGPYLIDVYGNGVHHPYYPVGSVQGHLTLPTQVGAIGYVAEWMGNGEVLPVGFVSLALKRRGTYEIHACVLQ